MKDYVPPDYEEEEDEDTDDEESTGTEESAPPSEEAEPPSSAGAAAVKASKASSKGSKAGKEGQGGLTPYQPAPPDDPIPKGVEDCFGRLYLATDVHCKQCDEHTDRGVTARRPPFRGTKSKKKSKPKEATKEAEDSDYGESKGKIQTSPGSQKTGGHNRAASAPVEAPEPSKEAKSQAG